MEQFLSFAPFVQKLSDPHFSILIFLFKAFVLLFIIISIVLFIYDRFIQRDNQLLINYPLIGRLRYFFYLLRDPMRQYFADEKFYESFDKVKWVYNAAESKSPYASFSVGQPIKSARLSFKNVNCVLNLSEVEDKFSVTFGEELKYPFKSSSVIGRSAMSDGAISPEGTRAFSKGAYLGGFPINTGEGGLTTNFLYTHRYNKKNNAFLDVKEGTFFAKFAYKILRPIVGVSVSIDIYRKMVIGNKEEETYLFDEKSLVCFRVNYNAPIEAFPKKIPKDIPDIILQIGSGLYGVRHKNGEFNEEHYQKVMRFARMTEIKMAQGAKQTGGKLLACKVSDAVAYYRGIEPHKDIFSPNQFPFAHTLEELFDFIGKLKLLSQKPVGVKIVLSTKENFIEYADLLAKRLDEKSLSYPDFITIDGAYGGSGTAPLEMMMSVGMTITKALHIADTALRERGIRGKIKLIASEKVLTPDDATVLFGMGADYVAIARAFMMSAGCIRARECSGANGRNCPVGLATQDKSKRASFLVEQKSRHIARYHDQMISSMRNLLAIMGIKKLSDLNKNNLVFKDSGGRIHVSIDEYFNSVIVE